MTLSQELAAVEAQLEACAFKELGGGGAGQEADSPETLPPARSFLGRGGAAPPMGPPLSGRLVGLSNLQDPRGSGVSELTRSGYSRLGVPPTKAQVC